MSTVADAYLDCWNETDAATRRALLEQWFTADVSYVDPLAEVTGLEQFDAAIAAVRQQFPGFVFTALGDVDGHHRLARFRWGLGPAGAEPVVEGSDVVVTDADGRIRSVLGFLDRVPS